MSSGLSARSLERYIPGESTLHRADARVKVLAALAFVAAVASFPPGAWAAFGATAGLVWGAAALANVGLRRVLLRTLVALPFALVAFPAVFTRSGDVLISMDLGPFTLDATDTGAIFFASVVLKSWISVTAAVLLSATTPFTEVARALSSLRAPSQLVLIITFMYRYVFVLVDEAGRMLRARWSRSAGQGGGGSIAWRARVTGAMAGTLFIRTYERAERVYMAMVARGFDGAARVDGMPPMGARSLVAVGIVVAVTAGVAVLARLA